MNAFDKVIGYDIIKAELLQICDMINCSERYINIGAELPHGVLLYGNPGLGKTLMCNAFIEETGLPSFTVRRKKNDAEFISTITDTFEEAKKSAPSVVFLDDLDKYSNDDSDYRDTEEYVAVQTCIDEAAPVGVFVIATVNNIEKLPCSLIRSGRFDRLIEVSSPTGDDARKIIAYYLSGKKVSPSVDIEDVAKMVMYSSCAELETIMNEAAISAAYKRCEYIEMPDIINAVLKMQYHVTVDDYTDDDNYDERRRAALHEAGHLVCSEVIRPGSVGFASICSRKQNGIGGFVRKCIAERDQSDAVTLLASKAAVELYYADKAADGCSRDMSEAAKIIRAGINRSAYAGFSLLEMTNGLIQDTSELYKSRLETVIYAQLEIYMLKAKDILIKNREFLERTADELQKNGILLFSDIRRIRESVRITPVSV